MKVRVWRLGFVIFKFYMEFLNIGDRGSFGERKWVGFFGGELDRKYEGML